MKYFSRKEVLKIIGFSGISSVFGSLISRIQGATNMKNDSSIIESDPIIEITALPKTGPWPTKDPFLFCVHHNDHYPKANESLGPDAPLNGRDIGQDFSNKDGWSMYHGENVPGFPRHPHRGFETVTIVNKGLIDHADSLGSSARYGDGDVQWLTAGDGIQHAEMFPLFNKDKTNPMSFFQIWINLPSIRKRVKPNFLMFWSSDVPVINVQDVKGRLTSITVVAGSYGQNFPPDPPPDSWASEKKNDVAMWIVKLEPSAEWIMPSTVKSSIRSLYIISGGSISIAGRVVKEMHQVEIMPDVEVKIVDFGKGSEILILQGKPISEPIAKYGPFVMNNQSEIRDAYYDYQKTQFGGWDWGSDGPVHGKDYKRFAKYINGKKDFPKS